MTIKKKDREHVAMELGGFGTAKNYIDIKKAGFDYAELDIPELEDMSEYGFRVFCDRVREECFPVLAGARAIPVSQPWFFTESFHLTEYRGYLERACRRAGQLGMKKIIFGNGRSRSLINEDSIKKEKNFIDFMRMFAEIAGEFGLEAILEPLGPRYTNYINTLPEAVRVIHEVNMPNLFSMADLRHMFWSKEDFEDIKTYSAYVRHIHIDYPKSYPERRFPSVSDDYDYLPFFEAVKNAGCAETVTAETDVPESWKQGYEDLSQLLDLAGL